MNPAQGEKIFRFPRAPARKQDPDPSILSQQEAGCCLLAVQDLGAWSDGCPLNIALGLTEFPAPVGERIIPCLFALICF